VWIADDESSTFWEVDLTTGVLISSVTPADLLATVQFKNTALATLENIGDLEAMAYDPVEDYLYAFNGNCCGATPNISSAFRLTRQEDNSFAPTSYNELPATTDFSGAAALPTTGEIWVGQQKLIFPYDYETNTLGDGIELDVTGKIYGMGFSEDGVDLIVVTSADRLFRINWETMTTVSGYSIPIPDVLDARSVVVVGDEFVIGDGDGVASNDPLALGMLKFSQQSGFPPIASVTSLIDDAVLLTTPVIAGIATDDTAVEQIRFQLRDNSTSLYVQPDGTLGAAYVYQIAVDNPGTASSLFSWTPPDLVAGSYHIRYQAEDDTRLLQSPLPRIDFVVNTPPVANAGSDITYPSTDDQQLDGSGSLDSDGTIISYEWRMDGTSTVIATGESPSLAPALAEGVYSIELTVTDDLAATSTDTVWLTVDAAVVSLLLAPTSAQDIFSKDLAEEQVATDTELTTINVSAISNSLPRLTPQAEINLADLDGSNGYTLEGAAAGDLASFGLSMIGDFNNDGIDDFAIGSYLADLDGVENVGQAYVIFGDSDGSVSPRLQLASLNGTNGFALNFSQSTDQLEDDRLGISINSAGDMNGDGITDLIVTRYQGDIAGSQAGDAYVIFGTSQPMLATFDLGSINGSNGFSMIAADAADRLGLAASTAGDFNGDGLDDLVIGSYQADENGDRSGAAYVVFGSSTGYSPIPIDLDTLNGSNGFEMNGVAANDEAGGWVSGGRDFNNDGFDDVIVASRFSDSSATDAGSVYIIFGTSTNNGASIELSALDGTNGFQIRGAEQHDQLGISAEPAGDINDDGFQDIVIGAHQHGTVGRSESGAVYVIFGKATYTSTLDVSSMTSAQGFKIIGANTEDRLGKSVHTAGDVDGDGIDDIVSGAESADSNGSGNSGRTYVVYGQSSANIPELDLLFLDETQGYFLNGVNRGDKSGRMVRGGKDVNNDGLDDILISAHVADPSGKTDAGEAYVVYGDFVFGNNTQTLLASSSSLTTSGQYVVEDSDTSDTVIATVESVVISGTVGSLDSNDVVSMLTIPTNALDSSTDIAILEWQFSSGSELFDYLSSGQSTTLLYTIRVADNAISAGFVDDFISLTIEKR
jgi:hypothetical protein